MVFSSVAGHLLELDFVPPYNTWQGCRPAELYTARVEKKTPQGENERIKHNLQSLARSCQKLILWLDCDREGENIAFEVISVCSEANPRISILRARFSALISADLYRAVQNLVPPNVHEADAVDARQEIDLRIGASFTRLQTLILQRKFNWRDHPAAAGRESPLLSYGPCQFPTLGLIVQREWEIQAHISQQFWYLSLLYKNPNNTRQQTVFKWQRDRLFDHAIAQAYLSRCISTDGTPHPATVLSVDGTRKTRWAPTPLSTLEMQKRGTQYLRGLSGEQIMKLAEELYQAGYISYPRTETTMFDRGYNLAEMVRTQADSGAAWAAYAQQLVGNTGVPQQKFRWPRDGGQDDKAHPPIHPTKAFQGDNNPDKLRLYEFIVRHFLACCSHDAVGQETKVTVDVSQEKFTAIGLMVIERNWLDVYPYTKWGGAEELPHFQRGETFMPAELSLKEGSTQPAPRMSERDLLAKMESFGIGTDATVADHIAKQLERGYAEKEVNQSSGIAYFFPTPLGEALISAYKKMGLENLWQPRLRGLIEANITSIARGQASKAQILTEAILHFSNDFRSALQQGNKLVDEVSSIVFPASQPLQPAGQSFGRCVCGADLLLIPHEQGAPTICCSSDPLHPFKIDLPPCALSAGPCQPIQHCQRCAVQLLDIKFNPRMLPPGYAPSMTVCVLCNGDFKRLMSTIGYTRTTARPFQNHNESRGRQQSQQGGVRGTGRGRDRRNARGR